MCLSAMGKHIFLLGDQEMKRKTIFQTKAVTGHTPEESALLFNEAMQELADLYALLEVEGVQE